MLERAWFCEDISFKFTLNLTWLTFEKSMRNMKVYMSTILARRCLLNSFYVNDSTLFHYKDKDSRWVLLQRNFPNPRLAWQLPRHTIYCRHLFSKIMVIFFDPLNVFGDFIVLARLLTAGNIRVLPTFKPNYL